MLPAVAALAAKPEAPAWDTSDVWVETGLLWQVGKGTPLSYRLVPTQLSWRSGEVFGGDALAGRVVVRHRVTFFGTWIQQGPESRYLALAVAPSVEWWNRPGTWSIGTAAGGGAGWVDARGVAGGQGQDFTLNWFARIAIEHVTSNRLRWSAGVMFQHLSNGGQTDPNPGIDAVGFTFGGAWSF